MCSCSYFAGAEFSSIGEWINLRMIIFLGVLMAGFFYAWDNGALEWH